MENDFLKLELRDYTPDAYPSDKTEVNTTILYEVKFIKSDLSETEKQIDDGLSDIDKRLSAINEKVNIVNAEIDTLTNHADGVDYAIASGVLAGLIDSTLVGEFSFARGKEWGSSQVDQFVQNVAGNDYVTKLAERELNIKGYNGNNLADAIRYLENFGLASDSVTAEFGGGLQHHLRDFAHHPTPAGLLFSLMTQFTCKAYGTNTAGQFMVIPVKNLQFIGNDFPQKILYGVIFWILHLASDMAGSKSTPGAGTGIPGPILSIAKELSAIPLFNDEAKFGELKTQISKLFNGTFLAQRDEAGNILKDQNGKALIERFDLRAEIGVGYELGRQAIPVVLNEVLVRGFYFLRRLLDECKVKESIQEINWRAVLPFKNRTIVRMLTISTGTFTAVDLVDAAARAMIESGGVNPETMRKFLLKVNFVGIGRFAIAVTTDVKMGFSKVKKETERERLLTEQLALSNAKLYYKQASLEVAFADLYEKEAAMHSAESELWIEVANTDKAMQELYKEIQSSVNRCATMYSEVTDCIYRIETLQDTVEENNPGLWDEIFRR